MQAFNLTRLNFHSPYKVWVDNGSYKFLTDYGVQYRIEFVEKIIYGRMKKRTNSAFSMKTRRIRLTILKSKRLYNVSLRNSFSRIQTFFYINVKQVIANRL